MAKCVNCAWFPWKPGADFSGLPAMRCHPKLAARRWTRAGTEAETSCPLHEAVGSETPDNAAEVKVARPAPESKTPAKAKSATKAKPKPKSKSKKE